MQRIKAKRKKQSAGENRTIIAILAGRTPLSKLEVRRSDCTQLQLGLTYLAFGLQRIQLMTEAGWNQLVVERAQLFVRRQLRPSLFKRNASRSSLLAALLISLVRIMAASKELQSGNFNFRVVRLLWRLFSARSPAGQSVQF